MLQYHAFPWYSKTFLFYLYVEYDTRWNFAHEDLKKKNKGTLITNNVINKYNILIGYCLWMCFYLSVKIGKMQKTF